MPWEREVYVNMLAQHLQKERDRIAEEKPTLMETGAITNFLKNSCKNCLQGFVVLLDDLKISSCYSTYTCSDVNNQFA